MWLVARTDDRRLSDKKENQVKSNLGGIMPCDCHLEAEEAMQNRVLLVLLTINAAMFCAEVVAGIFANSSALLADSLDMLDSRNQKCNTRPDCRSGHLSRSLGRQP
jgi:hypothetical protein